MNRLAFEGAYLGLPSQVRSLLETEIFRQVVRFGISGASAVLLSASLYLLLVYGAGSNPFVATAFGHVTGLATAYALHSRWSFGGARQRSETVTIFRFLAVSTFCFGLNNLWVALTTVLWGLPLWAPVPLMVLVTPVVSFVLNRSWVFGAQLRSE